MHYFLSYLLVYLFSFIFVFIQNLPDNLLAEYQLAIRLAAELRDLRTRAKASGGSTAQQTTSTAASRSALLSTSMCLFSSFL